MHPNPHEPTTAMPAGTAHPDRLLRLPQVLAAVGLGRTAILDRVKRGQFPAPLRLGRATLWPESAVQRWLADRIREAAPTRSES